MKVIFVTYTLVACGYSLPADVLGSSRSEKVLTKVPPYVKVLPELVYQTGSNNRLIDLFNVTIRQEVM